MFDHGEAPVVFLDFDGTISNRDVVDVILERHADPRWLVIEREWQAGRLGSRECLRQQLALVRATPREIDALLAEIEIDAGLVPLVESCARHAVPLHIVSDGFDYCIERILARLPAAVKRCLAATRVSASHLECSGGSLWRTAFPFYSEPCAHGCATCKTAVMQALNPDGAAAVFVGDGLSDRYAAGVADVVFAKHRLAGFCAGALIPHIEYRDLSAVAAFLDAYAASNRWRPALPSNVRA
jgi:2-hydroxy-3-keto-5-methylthiopentenyl-1-phosphate phosphatase